MKNYFLALVCFLVLGFAPSCKDDEEAAAQCVAGNYATTAVNAALALATAELAYDASAQTAADCTTLQAAHQTYIDALKDFDNCPGFTAQQQADLDQAIQDAEAAKAAAC